MDPNVALERLRRLAAQVLKDIDHESHSHIRTTRDTTGDELAQLFDVLDKWITGGGFLPRDWRKECGH